MQVATQSIWVGIALSLVGEKADPLMNVLNSLSAGIFKLVAILMKAAPIGAFGAMAFTIGKYGIASVLVASRLARIVPVSREMILNFVAQTSLGLPRSY